METNENTTQITVDLTADQYAFLTKWQKTHEQELGIEVPIAALVRKTVENAMKAEKSREERPMRAAPERKSFGDKKSFGDRKPFGGGERKSFGDRKPSFGGGRSMGHGPKFDMANPRNKTRVFDK